MDSIVGFFTDPLRLTLIVAAIVVIAGIIVFSRRPPNVTRELSQNEINNALAPPEDDGAGPVRVVSKDQVSRKTDGEAVELLKSAETFKPKKETAIKWPDEFIIIHLVAPMRSQFNGPTLLDAFKQLNLEYGDYKIFHYFNPNDRSQPVFSVVNMRNPGYFEPERMEKFNTTGISLFMGLPVVSGSTLDGFSKMLTTAQALTKKLGGELKDKDRRTLTPDSISRIRNYIAGFDTKAKSH